MYIHVYITYVYIWLPRYYTGNVAAQLRSTTAVRALYHSYFTHSVLILYYCQETTSFEIPIFWQHIIVTGNVAAELSVPNAVIRAALNPRINVTGFSYKKKNPE
jgi:hypothetical protein